MEQRPQPLRPQGPIAADAMSTALPPTIRDEIYAPSVPELIRQMRRKGQLGFFMDAWRDYGDLPHLKLGGREMFLVIHPDHVRRVTVSHADNYDKLETYDIVRELLLGEGLVASRGELWRRQRRLMAPFFTLRAIPTPEQRR